MGLTRNSLSGCVEREGIRVGTRWSCEEGECMMSHFVGRLLESGSVLKRNLFSMQISLLVAFLSVAGLEHESPENFWKIHRYDL